MILRNHGIVACGSTIEEAYHYAFNVVKACISQVGQSSRSQVFLQPSDVYFDGWTWDIFYWYWLQNQIKT